MPSPFLTGIRYGIVHIPHVMGLPIRTIRGRKGLWNDPIVPLKGPPLRFSDDQKDRDYEEKRCLPVIARTIQSGQVAVNMGGSYS